MENKLTKSKTTQFYELCEILRKFEIEKVFDKLRKYLGYLKKTTSKFQIGKCCVKFVEIVDKFIGAPLV